MTSDLPYLGHIADAISAIQSYVAGGREVFMSDRLRQDAVIRNFEIIGEGASHLSAAARSPQNDVWRKVIAFRNRLIHGYWSIDPALVWDVIEKDLPLLKLEAARLMSERSDLERDC